jgi:hypothetical protein
MTQRISRRSFIEGSIKGGLAVGIGSKLGALPVAASTVSGTAKELILKVVGNPQSGYAVDLYLNGRSFAQHNQSGEFSARFQNEERSIEDLVDHWKAASWSGNSTHISLAGECKLKNLKTTVFVQLDYELITASVVRKQIRLQQSDMFMLFYQLTNRLEAAEEPAKFWSFDQLEWNGGPLREYFPAAGFRTKDGVCVGLLTDSGFRNQWTRTVRRDGQPTKPAPRRIADANLYSGSAAERRNKGDFFVQQTFGEVLAQKSGEKANQNLVMPGISGWKIQGAATLHNQDDAINLMTKTSDDGVLIPFSAQALDVYEIRLQYRSSSPVAIEIWDVDENMERVIEVTRYNDAAPASAKDWSDFETTVFLPELRGSGCALWLSVAPSEQAMRVDTVTNIDVRGLQVRRVPTISEPYHRLGMGTAAEKVAFVFADETVPDTVWGHRLASQIHLSEALGFKGGQTEKILYADLMMLCWIAGPESFRPICAPSIWYSAAGEMYLRDSFFALSGTYNRQLNQQVFNLWAENQGEDGAINTLMEPNLANVERKSNDSTPLWLMWALLNRRRFGIEPPPEKLRKAAEYCLATYDPRRQGVCSAQFVMGQLDVIRYPQGTSEICENQGMLAVTARVIRELQIAGVSDSMTDAYLAKAEELYLSYYDPVKKFLRPARRIADAIGFADIFPEYLSLWLFGRKILTDEMVVNHLDRIPVMMPRSDCPHPEAGGTVRPILIGLPEGSSQWRYFDQHWHPMVSDSFAASYANHGMDGIYYNGGSWMRIEICGYATGKLHGWRDATKSIGNRLWAEIHIAPDFPTSQEYLATDPAHPFFGYHRVFAWNSFVLQALELAGLRDPRMDPDYTTK